jgi:hypothetical protein
VLLKYSVLFLAGFAFLEAQTAITPEVFRARQTVADLRAQVSAGITPRQKLEQAEAALADLQDSELLNRMVDTADLTEDLAAELTAAAQRRLDRTKAIIEKQQRLVDAGVDTAQTLPGLIQEREWAQTQYDLTIARTEMVQKIAEMARAEQQIQEIPEVAIASAPPSVEQAAMERFDGAGSFSPKDFEHVQVAFMKEFHKPLPVSAEGGTAVHRAMGFDHRNRVDVAIFPDTPEGLWLRHYLETAEIPYYAFRSAIPVRQPAPTFISVRQAPRFEGR